MTEPAELTQQFKLFGTGDGLEGTTGAECIQVIGRQFVNGVDLPGFAERLEMIQRVPIFPHR